MELSSLGQTMQDHYKPSFKTLGDPPILRVYWIHTKVQRPSKESWKFCCSGIWLFLTTQRVVRLEFTFFVSELWIHGESQEHLVTGFRRSFDDMPHTQITTQLAVRFEHGARKGIVRMWQWLWRVIPFLWRSKWMPDPLVMERGSGWVSGGFPALCFHFSLSVRSRVSP